MRSRMKSPGGALLVRTVRCAAIAALLAAAMVVWAPATAAPTSPWRPRPLLVGKELRLPVLRESQWDTIQIVARRRVGGLRIAAAPPDTSASAPHLVFRTMSRFTPYERPRFARVVLGADRMAGTAAALSGIGLLGGLWGEETAATMIGAGAILGAIWGGTLGADDPALRIGFDTSVLGRAPLGPYPFPSRGN